MLKKLLFIMVLCMGSFALFIPNVTAYPPAPGNWGAWPKCVAVWSDWKGVGDYESNPSWVEVTLTLKDISVHFYNPGDQGGGISENFYPPDATVTGSEGFGSDPDAISKNGRYLSWIEFEDYELWLAIPEDYRPYPPNPGWSPDVTVWEMDVLLVAWVDDIDGDGVADPVSTTGGTCYLNADGTEYNCIGDPSLDWVWKAKDPDPPVTVE
jgi:hypothetical protein